MFDPIFCNACGETNDIGGLIGELTNDCPNCARPVLLKQQPAHQGGYQPAMVEGLANVLNELESFTTTENHIDFPNTVLHVPKLCVGIVERSINDSKEGSVSILFKDTITARRLIARAEK